MSLMCLAKKGTAEYKAGHASLPQASEVGAGGTPSQVSWLQELFWVERHHHLSLDLDNWVSTFSGRWMFKKTGKKWMSVGIWSVQCPTCHINVQPQHAPKKWLILGRCNHHWDTTRMIFQDSTWPTSKLYPNMSQLIARWDMPRLHTIKTIIDIYRQPGSPKLM